MGRARPRAQQLSHAESVLELARAATDSMFAVPEARDAPVFCRRNDQFTDAGRALTGRRGSPPLHLNASSRGPKCIRAHDGPSEVQPTRHVDKGALARHHRPTPIFHSRPNNREPSNSRGQGQPRSPRFEGRAAPASPRLPEEARVAGLPRRRLAALAQAAAFRHSR